MLDFQILMTDGQFSAVNSSVMQLIFWNSLYNYVHV